MGPFSAAYFPIAALSLGVYRLYFPRLAVDAVGAVMAFPTNAFITSNSLLDKEGTLVGSDTEDKLEDEPLFFLLLYEKIAIKTLFF